MALGARLGDEAFLACVKLVLELLGLLHRDDHSATHRLLPLLLGEPCVGKHFKLTETGGRRGEVILAL